MKESILMTWAVLIFILGLLAIASPAEARGRHHFGSRNHHNNCHKWRMMPFHGHMVGRWICGAGKF